MTLTRLPSTALVLLAVISASPSAFRQERSERREKRSPGYTLVDIGTFGGPASYVNPPLSLGAPNQMNRYGTTVGTAATSIPFPFGNDGQDYVFHAFQWSHGIVKDLGALPGELNSSLAISINSAGTTVGQSENGSIDPITGARESRAVLWKDGRIRNLGTFGGNYSVAAEINDRGQVIGSALNAIPDPFSFLGLFLGSSNSTQTRAFLWEDGHKRDLGTLGGPDAFAARLNDRGEVAGVSYIDSVPNPDTGLPTRDPFVWRRGQMIHIGNFGGHFSGVDDINNRGQVIGEMSLEGDQVFDPFFWDDGRLIDLHSQSRGGNPYTANAINDAGQVVGAGAFPGRPDDAYVWMNGVAMDLGTLDGDCSSEAFVINSKGQIAGESRSCDGSTARVFLWQNGTMYELNSLIPANSDVTVRQALVINDRGEIGGVGTSSDCEFYEVCGHAVILIPRRHGDSDLASENASGTMFIARTNVSPAGTSPLSTGVNLTGRDLAVWRQARFGRHHSVGLPWLK